MVLIVLALVADLRADPSWKDLFDGHSLTNWAVPDFGGSGKVRVKDGAIHLGQSEGCTGITYTNAVPRNNYEIEVTGKRIEGRDFWCGLTFPVGKDHISLILGGWGGSVVGLSSLDGLDASQNETKRVINFENDRWYVLRVRVADGIINVWLDGKSIEHVDTRKRRVGIRMEVDFCVPLGIATWQTHSAIRSIRLRSLRSR